MVFSVIHAGEDKYSVDSGTLQCLEMGWVCSGWSGFLRDGRAKLLAWTFIWTLDQISFLRTSGVSSNVNLVHGRPAIPWPVQSTEMKPAGLLNVETTQLVNINLHH